ncbi:hypothetical protein [uncultured Chryseobacterium sp.]|uniref:hypothetical protein n=1 Tax=uncultured Chryseobacterium sp. TaxID=259322 RepID=UPI003747E2A5
MTLERQIESELVKYNERDLPTAFVSIAVQLSSVGEPNHAGIFIRYRGVDNLFHFPGSAPPIVEDITDVTNPTLIYKVLDNFDSDDDSDVGSFLRHCQRVCLQTDITYGFIFDGSTYDDDGRYLSLSGLPEIATCVGFCVNILSNFIIDINSSYFELSEWDETGIISHYETWAIQETEKKYPSLDWNLYNSFRKRISPLEYLCSGFGTIYPIKKEEILNIQPLVERQIQIKLV